MRMRRFRWTVVCLSLAPLACAGGDELTSPAKAAPTLQLAIVSGDGQTGKAGEELAEPFVVRVTDAGGRAVRDVVVTWTGRRLVGSGLRTSAGVLTVTDHQGLARQRFVPTVLGTSAARASIAQASSPVTFRAEADVLVVSLWWLRGWVGPTGSPDVGVPVGTPVEWNRDEVFVRVRSTSVPDGGASFDSDEWPAGTGEHFRFVPEVAGTWQYVIEHEGDTLSVHALTAW